MIENYKKIKLPGVFREVTEPIIYRSGFLQKVSRSEHSSKYLIADSQNRNQVVVPGNFIMMQNGKVIQNITKSKAKQTKYTTKNEDPPKKKKKKKRRKKKEEEKQSTSLSLIIHGNAYNFQFKNNSSLKIVSVVHN